MTEKLYHGSVNIIEKPLFGYGKPYNDYGLGFYCTDSLEMAKEWGLIYILIFKVAERYVPMLDML